MGVPVDSDNEVNSEKGPRIFSRMMKSVCWNRERIVPGRDPDRWRYDRVGNVVCRALTSCAGPLCHECNSVYAVI